MQIQKLTQKGVSHLLVPLLIIVGIGAVGTYLYTKSNAYYPTWATVKYVSGTWSSTRGSGVAVTAAGITPTVGKTYRYCAQFRTTSKTRFSSYSSSSYLNAYIGYSIPISSTNFITFCSSAARANTSSTVYPRFNEGGSSATVYMRNVYWQAM